MCDFMNLPRCECSMGPTVGEGGLRPTTRSAPSCMLKPLPLKRRVDATLLENLSSASMSSWLSRSMLNVRWADNYSSRRLRQR